MWLLPLLVACHRPPVDPLAPCAPGPDAGVATAAALSAGPTVARFSLHAELGDRTINAQGALLLAPPASLRLEVSGPVGPPQLVVTSNGTRVAVWQAGERTLLEAADGPALLDQLTGGAIGAEAITAVLLARIPAPEPGTTTSPTRWTRADGAAVDLTADCDHPETLASLVVTGAGGAALLDLHGRSAKGRWDTLELNLQRLGLRLSLDFDAWKPATPSAAAFDLAAPPGATVRDLGDLLAPVSPAGTTAPLPAPP